MIESAELVLGCRAFQANLDFFEGLGFRVLAIFPADAPGVAVLEGFGLRLRLEHGAPMVPVLLRLNADSLPEPAEVVAPNGVRLQFHLANPPLEIPPLKPSFVLSRAAGNDVWHMGRAGMMYRDLIPNRQGGRFIASHIRIPDGGPVPDYAHFHKIRFQMIFVYKGWVRVVYEDQGEPFVMRAGDCVLQPPQIRHRVLESSPGLEVVELGCPAEHETLADPSMQLPTDKVLRDRDFGGQRFTFHRAEGAVWEAWRLPGFLACNTRIAEATHGLAQVRVVRRDGGPDGATLVHHGEFQFWFVLKGSVTLARGSEREELAAGDSVVMPPHEPHALADVSDDFEMLEVLL